MAFSISQNDYSVIKQPYRNMFVKINLLNFKFQTIGTLEGNIINGSTTINADSDIRRTCNVQIVVNDSSFRIDVGGKIWIDKYIQVFIGTELTSTGEIQWTNLGIYLINNPDHVYDLTTDTISFQGLDLMARLTGVRNGYLEGIPTKIPMNSNIRSAIISTLALAGFTRYSISENPQSVPYDILIDRGGTVFDILSELRNISPEYEMFFNTDGIFVYQRIPLGQNDPVIIDNDILDNTVLSISNTVDFENVKNSIEVWGKSLEPQFFGGTAGVSGSTYSISVTGLSSFVENVTVGFVVPSVLTNPNLKINSLATRAIVNENGTPAVIPEADQYYVVRILPNGKFLFLGHQQIRGSAKDTNPESPYYINGSSGIIFMPLYGNGYDTIVTDDLASQRARYELYLRARLNDSITVSSTIIPWIDVNMKIRYTNKEMDFSGDFLIKSVTMSLDVSGTMSFTASRFYSLYPFL